MLNIFNLFLSLFACWLLFMVAAGSLSWFYVFFGVIASALVSFVSHHFKLIEKKSELLYLSLGFYSHFIKVFLSNFISSIKLIIRIIFIREPLYPTIHTIEIDPKYNFNPALIIATINMTTGLFCIQTKKDTITIHAIDQDYFENFDLIKTCKTLSAVNDDNLV